MNKLIKHEQLPISDITSIGKTFAESGLFADVKSAQQAVVKIMAGQEIGLPPFAAMSGIHVIQGKPVIGSGLIAARIKGSGKYDYKVVQHDEKTCSIDFYQGSEKIGNSTFSLDDAKKAGTKNLDKFPKNMLFARAISNGVKWYCPDVFAGPVYVPEEIQNITEDATPTSVETEQKKKPATEKDIKQIEARMRKEGSDLVDVRTKALSVFTFDDMQAEYLVGVEKEVSAERNASVPIDKKN